MCIYVPVYMCTHTCYFILVLLLKIIYLGIIISEVTCDGQNANKQPTRELDLKLSHSKVLVIFDYIQYFLTKEVYDRFTYFYTI